VSGLNRSGARRSIKFKYDGDATKRMGRSAPRGGIKASLLICTSELAGADGRINVESRYVQALDVSPGCSDLS